MRLRQLARKLGVPPEKILSALAEHGHTLENEANSKLTEEQVEIIGQSFEMPTQKEQTEEKNENSDPTAAVAEAAPETVEAIEERAAVEEVPEAAPFTEEVIELVIPEADTVKHDSTHEVPFGPPSHATSQVSDTQKIEKAPEGPTIPKKIQLEPEVNIYRAYEEDESYAEAELIKAETPVLEGLKVVGKIELPEPKKPATKEESEESQEKDEKRQGRQRNQRGRKGRSPKERINSVEYERKKAERLAKKKKAEAERRLKEKRKEHYLTQVKAKPATDKPKKKQKTAKEEEEMTPLPIIGQSRPKPQKKVPQGPKRKKGLKKLWAWLNGEYDKF